MTQGASSSSWKWISHTKEEAPSVQDCLETNVQEKTESVNQKEDSEALSQLEQLEKLEQNIDERCNKVHLLI